MQLLILTTSLLIQPVSVAANFTTKWNTVYPRCYRPRSLSHSMALATIAPRCYRSRYYRYHNILPRKTYTSLLNTLSAQGLQYLMIFKSLAIISVYTCRIRLLPTPISIDLATSAPRCYRGCPDPAIASRVYCMLLYFHLLNTFIAPFMIFNTRPRKF